MGLLSGLFGKRLTTTKAKLVGMIAGVLDQVIADLGCAGIINGTVSVLREGNGMGVQYGGKIPPGDALAIIKLSSLEDARLLSKMGKIEPKDVPMVRPLVDMLALAIFHSAAEQSPMVAKLPAT